MKTNTKIIPHVAIIGAGFGGLRAARALSGKDVKVTLIDRNNYHLFQPLLYQVATAGLAANEIAYPLRGILRNQKNLTFHMAEVTNIDLAQSKIHSDQGVLNYDYLLMAVGSETNYFGNSTLAEKSFGLKDIDEAEAIRNHILTQFERASVEPDSLKRWQLLTFVVVGGGPSGVEMAGALSELIRLVLQKDFPQMDFSEVNIILLEALDRLLVHLDETLSRTTAAVLEHKDVDVRFGQRVLGYDGKSVKLENREPLPANTLIWTAGVRSAGLVDVLHQEQAAQKRVRVLPTLQLPHYPQVFLIGDAAYFEDANGNPLPMVAQVAMQQADRAVANLHNLVSGKPLLPFKYKDLGSMATIGRNQAVAQIGGMKFRGFIAWLIWLFVHLMQLVGFRNRLVVLINWAWEYLTYDRAARLIERKDR